MTQTINNLTITDEPAARPVGELEAAAVLGEVTARRPGRPSRLIGAVLAERARRRFSITATTAGRLRHRPTTVEGACFGRRIVSIECSCGLRFHGHGSTEGPEAAALAGDLFARHLEEVSR